MAFNLIQAGTDLFTVNAKGGISSALTLPTSVTLSATRIPRFARFGRYVIVVNTPSRPLSVDDSGTVRPLTPLPPTSTPVLASETGGGLSGSFLAKQPFVFLDAAGNIIAESDFGPVPTNAQLLSAAYLRVTNLALSTDTSAISATRLYRTTKGPGGVYFQWATIDGNTQTRFRDDLPDEQLALLAAPSRGSAPDLTLIAEWQGRLWGVSRTQPDNLRFTEAGTAYAWSELNTLPLPKVGDDRFGITAIVPRRGVLGIGRQNRLVQVTGNTQTSIRPTGVVENCGILSQESVASYRDLVFFLWRDGVYQWAGSDVVSVSHRAGVDSWFQTNNYFNQAMFSQAFAVFNHDHTAYRLFLCSAGQTTFDRWIEYSLKTEKFYGPHKTTAFTPSCAINVRGVADRLYPMIGSRDGYLSQDTPERSDWGFAPIPMVVTMAGHDGDGERVEKYFGQLTVHTDAETKGTLNVNTTVGSPDSGESAVAMTHDLTIASERLDRIGVGKEATVQFENNELNQPVTLYGYEIAPVSNIGTR